MSQTIKSANKGKAQPTSAAFHPYPENCWYVVAGAAEVGETLLSREVLGTKVVLYRNKKGEPVALRDRCPHRGYPLSKGELIEDQIQCGYHGMLFNEEGRCTHVPSQGSGLRAMCTEKFAVAEKWLWVWIWMGDQELADPALIPDSGYENSNHHTSFVACVPIEANYQILVDNLLDPTHASYVHKGLLDDADSKQMAQAKYKVTKDDRLIEQSYCIEDFKPNEVIAQGFELEVGKPLTRRAINTFQPGCFINASARFTDPENEDRIVSEFVASVPITPVAPGRCYHFVASSSTFESSDERKAYLRGLIDQDKDASEAIQEDASVFDGNYEMSVRTDEAGVLARRMIMKMVAEESQNNRFSQLQASPTEAL